MNKPELILHIGTEKTGTTSIQNFLRLNRDAMARRSVFVPSFLGRSNHRLAPYLFQSDTKQDGFDKFHGVANNTQARSELKARTRKEWTESLANLNYGKWIISSEHFQSRLTTEREVGNLWDFLQQHYSKIMVIIYLRDPVYTAHASFSTWVKAGGRPSSMRLDPSRFEGNCNHKRIIERWLSVVPRENLLVRIFDKGKLIGGDVINDFSVVASIPRDELLFPDRENESLSLPAIRLMILLNERIPLHHGNHVNPIRKDLNKYIQEYFKDGPRFLPSARAIDSFDSFYRESIIYVKENFCNESQLPVWSRPAVFGEDLPKDGIVFEDHEVEIANLISSVWIKKTERINRLRSRYHG